VKFHEEEKYSKIKRVIGPDGEERIIRRRKRKSYDQLNLLMEIYEQNPEWTKEIMQEVSQKTGLSEAQVYKWGWDQK
jgi:NADH:ubiquinone oxidoreductase subunit E